MRAHVLRIEPLCRTCRAKGKVTVATEVDHIIPLHQGGEEFDPDNCQPQCHDCHAEKSARDEGKRPKVAIGIDGWPR